MQKQASFVYGVGRIAYKFSREGYVARRMKAFASERKRDDVMMQ